MTTVRAFIVCVATTILISRNVAGAEVVAAPRLVLARSAAVRFVDERKQSRPIPVGLLLDVLRVEGEWFWTGRGWVRQSEVVGLQQAVEFFTAEINRVPNVFAHVSRARAHSQLNAYDDALIDSDRALAIDPNSSPAYCQRGRALLGLRRTNAALDALNHATRLDSNSAIAYCGRAQALHALGDAATAMADYSRAIELDDKLVVAWFSRAGLRSQAGDVEGSLNDLTNVLRQHPNHFLALNNRANNYAKQGKWDQAVADYSAALKVMRRSDIFINRANAFRAVGKLQDAIADCNEAIRLDPNSETAYRQRAAILVESDRIDEADQDLYQAEQLAAADNRT